MNHVLRFQNLDGRNTEKEFYSMDLLAMVEREIYFDKSDAMVR